MRPSPLSILPMALAAASLWGASTSVIIQGKGGTSVHPQNYNWFILENGRGSGLPAGPGYRVPADRYLVVSRVAFTVHGAITKYSRGAQFVLAMKQGGNATTLAQFSGRFLASLKTSTVTERFTPGLVVPPGMELTGAVTEVVPGGEPCTLEVAFYGTLVPAETFKSAEQAP